MQNDIHSSKNSSSQESKEANCNASVSKPFFIFLGLAVIIAAVCYFIFIK